jgi:hypothetical protein
VISNLQAKGYNFKRIFYIRRGFPRISPGVEVRVRIIKIKDFGDYERDLRLVLVLRVRDSKFRKSSFSIIKSRVGI